MATIVRELFETLQTELNKVYYLLPSEFSTVKARCILKGVLDLLKDHIDTEAMPVVRHNFTVKADIVGKQRPRVTKFGTYTPTPTLKFEREIQVAYLEYVGETKLAKELSKIPITWTATQKKEWLEKTQPKAIAWEDPVVLTINAYFRVPQSYSKKKKEAILKRDKAPTSSHLPDVDNIIKSVEDALNGFAYKDDRFVVAAQCGKSYTNSAQDYIEITISVNREE